MKHHGAMLTGCEFYCPALLCSLPADKNLDSAIKENITTLWNSTKLSRQTILIGGEPVQCKKNYSIDGTNIEKRFEPPNTNFSHFWIYITAKAFTLPLESNLNIDKNRST